MTAKPSLCMLALSHGVGSDSQRPFAIVIVGGLISDLAMSISCSQPCTWPGSTTFCLRRKLPSPSMGHIHVSVQIEPGLSSRTVGASLHNQWGPREALLFFPCCRLDQHWSAAAGCIGMARLRIQAPGGFLVCYADRGSPSHSFFRSRRVRETASR